MAGEIREDSYAVEVLEKKKEYFEFFTSKIDNSLVDIRSYET